MNQKKILAILTENRLMQTEEQVTKFENALAGIADNPDEQSLSAYHLLLDDQLANWGYHPSLTRFYRVYDAI